MSDETEDLRREFLADLPELTEDDAPEAYAPGSLGMHEVLHMASFLMFAVERELMAHGAIATRPEWFKLANDAHSALFRLHQTIKAEHLKD